MFKTRTNKLLLEHQTIVVGNSFNQLSQADHITFIESCYPQNPSIIDIYNRVDKYKLSSDMSIEAKTTITLVEDDTNQPSFEITGPIILIYYYLVQNSIPDMIKKLIGTYVLEFMLPDTIDNDEFNSNVKKYICRKKHGRLFCPIESEEIKVGRTVCELGCGHHFTSRGIRKWLTKSNGHCPMCRVKVRTDIQEEMFVEDTTDHIMYSHYTGIYRMIE